MEETPKEITNHAITAYHLFSDNIPSWLTTDNADFIVKSGLCIILILTLIWIFWPRNSHLESGAVDDIIKPNFFSLRKQWKILAVHEFQQSNDISGYKHLGQNSRPDQWQKLIEIKTKFLFWHYISPINLSKILTVVISRDGKEKWKTISFNK